MASAAAVFGVIEPLCGIQLASPGIRCTQPSNEASDVANTTTAAMSGSRPVPAAGAGVSSPPERWRETFAGYDRPYIGRSQRDH